MSTFVYPVLVIGLNVEDIKTKSIEELINISESIIYACNTEKENVYFSFFNTMYEEEYSNAIFGFLLNSNESLKAIDLGIPLDQEKIKILSKSFKEQIGLEPKLLASFEKY